MAAASLLRRASLRSLGPIAPVARSLGPLVPAARSLVCVPPPSSPGGVELPPFVDQTLRGVGQVVFCDSPVSGGVMLGALCLGSPLVGGLALVGAATATATARAAAIDASVVASGLAGYNGCLVGCALAVFVGGPAAAVGTVTGSIATVFISAALRTAITIVPQYTLAFNAVTLSALAATQPLGAAAAEATAAEAAASSISPLAAAAAPLTGLSQIFVVESPISGALILGAIGWYSPGCAAHAALGATVGAATGAALGAPAAEISSGLWSFNPALTSLAASVFFVHSAPTVALSVAGAAATAALFGGLKIALASAFGVPALTLPFCAVAAVAHLLPQSVPALILAAAPHSPERNSSA